MVSSVITSPVSDAILKATDQNTISFTVKNLFQTQVNLDPIKDYLIFPQTLDPSTNKIEGRVGLVIQKLSLSDSQQVPTAQSLSFFKIIDGKQRKGRKNSTRSDQPETVDIAGSGNQKTLN